MKDIYSFEAVTINGETNTLAQYRGKVILIVNTASKCGFTGQYDGLQKLYMSFKDQGLVVLGFPSNDFMRQEPGSNSEIKSFCTLNYGVTFPMFAKIAVKGESQHPLYAWLTSKEANPETAGKISWNFNKFLITRDGKISGRFGSRTAPDDKALVQAIKDALAQ
ncbi:MAG: glutathione peroxidase [Kiritimatiellae bacterium]|nr:glutathione peroxidase [Kiritimatiellia bacterium]